MTDLRVGSTRESFDTGAAHHDVRAPRGKTISCNGWQQDAALRMRLNTLAPAVAAKQ